MKLSSRKLIKKLAVGGSTPDPLAGVGIQYVASAPELPNINAAMYFDQARRQSDDALQEERKKLLPDQKAIFELISKAPGTSGHKAIVSSEVADAIKHYRDRVSENPDWVFSQEGRDALYNIENLTSPARFQQMAEKQRQIQLAYDNAFKNGTLNQYHIRDGMISVFDSSTGQRVDVPMSEYERDQRSADPKFTALRVSEAYNLADSHQDFDMSAHQIFGDMMTPQQARAELVSYFDEIGKSIITDPMGITTVGSNELQREAAKQQAIAGLSQKAKDALRSDFIEKTGSYSEADFNRYLDNIIESESRKRTIFSRDVNASAMAALRAGKTDGAGETDGVVMPTEVPTSPNFLVSNNPTFSIGQKDIVLHRYSTSNIETNKDIKPISFSGDVFLYGDFGWTEQDTSDEKDGAPVKLRRTYRNASHVGNSVFAVDTGLMRKWNAKEKRYEDVTVSSYAKGEGQGRIITKNGDVWGIHEEAELKTGYTDEGQPYLYFENENRDHIIVELRGFKVYNIYRASNDNATFRLFGNSYNDELKQIATAMVPMNREESIQAFGVNRSGQHHNEENVVEIGGSIMITESAERALAEVMNSKYVKDYDKAYMAALFTALTAGPSRLTEEQRMALRNLNMDKLQLKQEFNQRINLYKDMIDDDFYLTNATRPKTSYTPKSSSDDRNIGE